MTTDTRDAAIYRSAPGLPLWDDEPGRPFTGRSVADQSRTDRGASIAFDRCLALALMVTIGVCSVILLTSLHTLAIG